jgi:hypothetical protein
VAVVHGTAPLASLEVVRSGEIVTRREYEVPAPGDGDADGGPPLPPFDDVASFPLQDLRTGEYVYLRVMQQDGHAAWTSPFFVD